MCTQRKAIGVAEEEIMWEGQGAHGHLDLQPAIYCPQALAAFTWINMKALWLPELANMVQYT